MGPQNLNNYYFNRLDAKLDYSSYYDFFLSSDERNLNQEVLYSQYAIGIFGNESYLVDDTAFPSDTLGVWMDLNKTGCTKQYSLLCNQYKEDNTLLSLSYWNGASPSDRSKYCYDCIACRTSAYTTNENFITSLCDIGLTGIDNGLVRRISGDTEYITITATTTNGPGGTDCTPSITAVTKTFMQPDFCCSAFTNSSTVISTFTASTDSGKLTNVTWASTVPSIIENLPDGTLNYDVDLPFYGTGQTSNFGEIGSMLGENTNFYKNYCEFSGNSAYTVSVHRLDNFSGVLWEGTARIETGSITACCQKKTINIWTELPNEYKHDPLHYDRRFKMHAVTGYSQQNINYNILSERDSSVGYYNDLYGGFYQGFYKLYGYPYQVLPERNECGWTVECLLKIRPSGSTNCAGTASSTNTLINMSMYPSGVNDHVILSLTDYLGIKKYYFINGNSAYGGTSTGSESYTSIYPLGFYDEKIIGGSTTPTTDSVVFAQCYGLSAVNAAVEIKTAVEGSNGHNGTIEVTLDGVGGITFTQAVSGPAGETTMEVVGAFGRGLQKAFWSGYDTSPIYAGEVQKATFTTITAPPVTGYDNTLNSLYPNNAGFYFYMGTRAENKYWTCYSGETGHQTCNEINYDCSGTPITLCTSATTTVVDKCGSRTILHETGMTYDNQTDVFGNSLGLRLTPDYRLGYRAVYFTGSCVNSGTCVTGFTYFSGITVQEEYTDVPICGLSGTTYINQSPWVQVTARFVRDYCWDDCDLYNRGGVNDLRKIQTPGLEAITDNQVYKEYLEFSNLWTEELKYRRGTLTFYVNGRPVLSIPDFEEIIPRHLNTLKQKQIGVPFNISWGGGSQGLIENQTINQTVVPPYVQDPNDLNLLIQENFAGTYDGGISQMKYYLRPLKADEIRHNYLVSKDRYSLIDCSCSDNVCRQGQVLYELESNSLDIILTFPLPLMSVMIDKLYLYINQSDWSGVKFKATNNDNVNSFTIKKYENANSIYTNPGLGQSTVENLPFSVGPNDVIEIIINKRFAEDEASKVTLIGNLYR